MAATQSLLFVSILLLALAASAQELSNICDFVGTCEFSDECPKACKEAGLNPDGSLCLPNPKASHNFSLACCCVKPGAAHPPM